MKPFKNLLASFRSLRQLTNHGRRSRRRQSLTISVAAECLEIRKLLAAADTTLPSFSNAQLNGKNPGNSSQVSLGQTLSFAGSVSDNVALAKLTVNISGPKGNDLTVVTSTVSGTSRSLSSYSINTSNTSYAGVAGNYTATFFAKDTSNNVSSKTWNFSVVVPDTHPFQGL